MEKNIMPVEAFKMVKMILSENSEEKDGYLIFKGKNKRMKTKVVQELLDNFVDYLIQNSENYDDYKDTIALILTGARINCSYIINIDEKIIKRLNTIKTQSKMLFMTSIVAIFEMDPDIDIGKEWINEFMKYKTLSADEALHIIIKYVGKDLFFENKRDFIRCLISSKEVIDDLLEQNFINEDDIKECINSLPKEDIIEEFEKHPKYVLFWLEYMNPELMLEILSSSRIDKKILGKHISVKSLISANVDKELIIEFINKKVLDTNCELDLWNLYESDYFSDIDMDIITRKGYINPNHIIDMYKQGQNRNIAVALEEIPGISINSLAKFLSPQRILKLENSNRTDMYNTQSKQFVRSELREIYSMFRRDLELELLHEEKQKNEEQEDKSKQKPLIDLYKSELVSLSKFEEGDISSEEIIKYYEETENPNILIEANNAGILSNLDLLDLIEDFDKICDLIEQGLNPTILNEFCEIKDILDLYKEQKVSAKNLGKLNIDIGKVKDLYVSESIEYEDLDILYKIGLITLEERQQIEEEYDIEAKLEELRKIGILGKDRSELGDPNATNNGSNGNGNAGQGLDLSHEEKILSDGKVELFKKLGASDPVYVKCDLFRDYIMYPIVDKRLAIFEGKDGATYIFPLKVVLEQVGKDLRYIKENDIIGQAENRRQLYSNRDIVKRVMHTCNWGVQLIQKMQELNPSLDAKQLREDCEDLTEDIREYYNLCKNAKTGPNVP